MPDLFTKTKRNEIVGGINIINPEVSGELQSSPNVLILEILTLKYT